METTYKLLKMLIWVLVFAVVMTGAYLLYNRLSAQVEMPGLATEPAAETAEQSAEDTEAKTNPAPDFTVYDGEGNPVRLSDFQGRPVILNFWASWCGPCKSEMPEFQNYYDTYGDQLHFVLVNLTDGAQETVDTASAYIAAEGYTFPVYFDTDIDAAYQYGVQAVPVTYFIDAEGNLVAYAQGALSADMLQQGVDLLLK